MAVAKKKNQPLFGVRVFVQVQHHFGSSKFKHSREGFNRFFYLFDLILLPFLLFLLLILQRVLKHFLTHFTAARFAFLLNQELTLETSSISLNLCLIVSFRYTIDFPFFIGTTQGESTINCGGVVDPNYFCFSQVMFNTTIQCTRDFFMYGSLKSLSDEKLRGDVYNTLLFDFAK